MPLAAVAAPPTAVAASLEVAAERSASAEAASAQHEGRAPPGHPPLELGDPSRSSSSPEPHGPAFAADARQCESLAHSMRQQYIGVTLERGEFPGCVRWGGGFVEFNEHTDESVGCNVKGGERDKAKPACLCSAAPAGPF